MKTMDAERRTNYVNISTSFGITALMIAARCKHAWHTCMNMFCFIPPPPCKIFTLLLSHFSARKKAAVELLLNMGASLTSRTTVGEGETSLSFAVGAGAWDIATLLIASGVPPEQEPVYIKKSMEVKFTLWNQMIELACKGDVTTAASLYSSDSSIALSYEHLSAFLRCLLVHVSNGGQQLLEAMVKKKSVRRCIGQSLHVMCTDATKALVLKDFTNDEVFPNWVSYKAYNEIVSVK